MTASLTLSLSLSFSFSLSLSLSLSLFLPLSLSLSHTHTKTYTLICTNNATNQPTDTALFPGEAALSHKLQAESTIPTTVRYTISMAGIVRTEEQNGLRELGR